MKLTKRQLKKIIRETIGPVIPDELAVTLNEHEEQAQNLLLNLLELYVETYADVDGDTALQLASEDLLGLVNSIISLQKDLISRDSGSGAQLI